MEKLLRLIKLLIKKEISAQVSVGRATNIDKNKRTCDVILNEDITIYDCRLNAISDAFKNHFLVTPKEKSYVTYQLIENQNTNAIIIGYSEIESIEIIIDDQKLAITKDGFIFNEGKNKGIIIADKLVSDLEKYSQILSQLQTTLNAFMPTGTVADGSALATALKAVMSGYQSPTFSDIKNDKIQH
ncbi:MAG: hypothetical protein H6Q15_1767 [Bacteroidetes bacterium]|nr:hypothetical protein [Bacteroidota bacterium]